MNVSCFYGTRKATKVTTIAEVQDAIENNRDVRNIVVLQPNAGDSESQTSDCEEITNDPEEIFEPAGEMEVEEEIYSDWCDDEPEVTLPPRTKRSRQGLPKWKKNDTLDRDFSPSEIN